MADKEETKKPSEERRRASERRTGKDRRSGADRRAKDVPVAVERRSGKERRKPGAAGERRKVERRINEYVLEPDVLEFINAVNEYKTVNQRPFPTWTEVFKILISLGYRKGD